MTAQRFERVTPDGARAEVARPLAIEAPIAIEYDGLGYAVLMATPADLEDLAYGFSLAERLIDDAGEIEAVEPFAAERGTIVRVSLAPERRGRVVERVRHRVSESSCGLCGIENLEQALRPLPPVTARTESGEAAIFAALAGLRDHQPLNAATGAAHAAALCGSDGAVRLVREDVGRHNALDKLVGAMLRGGLGWDGGFALVTSRLSYEMVEKAVLAGCPLLAAISAPTALAVARAADAGLPLVALARPDALLRTGARPEVREGPGIERHPAASRGAAAGAAGDAEQGSAWDRADAAEASRTAK